MIITIGQAGGSKVKKITLMLIALMMFLVACGQTEYSGSNGGENKDKAASEENKTENITISGVLGDVELEGAAQHVVALEWTYAENLLAVDVQPVGMADIAGYNSWVDIEKELSSDVVDVGTRQEPSLEEIAALEPDLIIAIKSRHEAIKNELESIAPTVFFDPYPTDESFNQYAEMEATFNEIAKAVGKTTEAEQVLAELEKKYEEAKATIDASDLDNKEVVLTQAYSANQAPEIRVFTPNALAVSILEKIGLQNVHESDTFEVYGFSTLNVEGLTKYEHANFIYVVQDNDNVFENQLKDNTVWKNLDFVQDNRTYGLGGDVWLFGGPLSAKTVVDRIVDIMVTN